MHLKAFINAEIMYHYHERGNAKYYRNLTSPALIDCKVYETDMTLAVSSHVFNKNTSEYILTLGNLKKEYLRDSKRSLFPNIDIVRASIKIDSTKTRKYVFLNSLLSAEKFKRLKMLSPDLSCQDFYPFVSDPSRYSYPVLTLDDIDLRF